MIPFLTVLLNILKIIGIVIASILGIVVFLILIILFVPVFYKGKTAYNDGLSAQAKVHWLMHIVSFSYCYGENPSFSLKIFGIRILPKDKNSKKKKGKKEKKKNKSGFTEAGTSEESKSPAAPDNTVTKKPIDSKEHQEKSPEEAPSKELSSGKPESAEGPLPEKTEAEEKISGNTAEVHENNADKETEKKNKTLNKEDNKDLNKEDNKDLNKEDKKKHTDDKDENSSTSSSVYDKISNVIEIIQSDEFEKTFETSKKKVIRLLRSILPRIWQINAEVGFDDPATTGKILAISGMLYPFIRRHINVTGRFDEEVIRVNANARGHITIFTVLIIAAELYFNKKIKKIIKELKEAVNG